MTKENYAKFKLKCYYKELHFALKVTEVSISTKGTYKIVSAYSRSVTWLNFHYQ